MSIGNVWLPLELVTAALPFLPRGKGATILILGGILVLVMAFLLSLVSLRLGALSRPVPGPQAVGAPTSLAAPIVLAGSTGLDDTRLGWSRPLLRGAVGAGIDSMTVLNVERNRVVVRVDACRSCASDQRTGVPCDAERRLFTRLGRRAGHRVEVCELLCTRQGQGACVFEIDRGTLH